MLSGVPRAYQTITKWQLLLLAVLSYRMRVIDSKPFNLCFVKKGDHFLGNFLFSTSISQPFK